MSFPVFDLHCDTLLLLADPRVEGTLLKSPGHVDIQRGKVLPAWCQCFACFTTPAMEQWGYGTAETVFRRELDAFFSSMQNYPESICQAFSRSDIEKNAASGRISAMLTLEGPAGISYDPAALEELWKLGFRITTLGWNEKNVLTGSCVTGGGLTDRGKEYVREAQRLGMRIDVSHISDEGFWDIMDITQGSVVATHSNSRTICPHPRNLTDEMFLEICRTGGVAGFNVYDSFVGQPASQEAVCAHFLHFMELDPEGKHIALGGDLDGCDTLIEGFSGLESYPALASVLLQAGLSERNIEDIFWNNALGVI